MNTKQQRQLIFTHTKTSKKMKIICFAFWCFFLCSKSFLKKKINRLKIVLIDSNTILLECTTLNLRIKNYFSTNFSTNFLYHIYFYLYALIFICQNLFSSVKTYFHLCALTFTCVNL